MEIVRTSRHNYVKYRDCWLFNELEFKNWKVNLIDLLVMNPIVTQDMLTPLRTTGITL